MTGAPHNTFLDSTLPVKALILSLSSIGSRKENPVRVTRKSVVEWPSIKKCSEVTSVKLKKMDPFKPLFHQHLALLDLLSLLLA